MDPKRQKYLTVFKAECEEHLRALGDHLLALERTPEDAAPLKHAMRIAHTLKGSAQLLGLAEISRDAHDIEDRLRRLEQGEDPATAEPIDQVLRALDVIRRRVAELLPQGPAAPAPAPTVTGSQAPASAAVPPPTLAPAAPARTAPTIRVPVDKVDGLLSAAGELALGRARLERFAIEMRGLMSRLKGRHRDPIYQELRRLYEGLSQSVGELDLAVRDVQDLTLSMRLLPCSTLFGDFPRAVRDLARELDKQARVELGGGETECDKDLLDAVREPLV